MAFRRLYNDDLTYTDEANKIAFAFEDEVKKLFHECFAKGIDPRDLELVLMNAVSLAIMGETLEWRSQEEANKTKEA